MFIDLHLYTDKFSELRLSPSGAIKNAIAKGLDGVVLVEKNKLWKAEEISALRKESDIPDSFKIFTGQEVECPEGDILVIGSNEELPNQLTSLELKQKVRNQGACSIYIPKKMNINSELSFLHNIKKNLLSNFSIFDSVEIYNNNLNKKLLREYNDFAQKKGVFAVGGSSSHQSALYATKFFNDMETEKDIANAIRNGKVSPVCIDGYQTDPKGGKILNIEWNIPKVSIMKSKGLIFDFYGTLVDLKSSESYKEFNKMSLWLSQENIQVSGETLMNYYRQRCSELYNNRVNKVNFPEVNILQVFRDAIALFSGEDKGEEFARKSAMAFRTLTIKEIRRYPHARTVLRELKRRKYRIGMISNAQAAFTMPEIEDLRLEQFFDFIILSSDVGCSKPDSEIFRLASRQIELLPQHTSFIGDDLHGDIFGAKKHGFKTVYVNTKVGSNYPVTPDVTLIDGDLRNLLRIFP